MIKRLPVGVCDHCGQPFPPGVSWYTRRGPRLYCSLDCRNTANSRAGAPLRSAIQRERVASGEWQSPHSYMSPEEISAAQAKAARRGRLREVADGHWRNPALSAEARRKLSRPRRHGDNPALHGAIEKLSRGERVADLRPEEAAAHREWRASLRAARRDEINTWRRAYHRRRMAADPEYRRRQREKWQQQNRKRAQR